MLQTNINEQVQWHNNANLLDAAAAGFDRGAIGRPFECRNGLAFGNLTHFDNLYFDDYYDEAI